MTSVRNLLGPLLLALYVVLVLHLAALAAPASGPGYGSELLLGHLADPRAAAGMRGAGLALIGLTLLLFPRLLPAGPVGRGVVLLMVGALLPWSASVLPAWATGADLAPRIGLALGGLLVLSLAARGDSGSEPTTDAPGAGRADGEADETGPHPTRPSLTELLRDLGGGAGLALALGALWNRLALVGYHEPAEDHLRLVVLLGLAAAGSLAFGPLVALGAPARRALGVLGPALVALGALAGLSLLAPTMSKDGLTHLLAGLADTDLTALGSPRVTAILAARALVGVGFAAGLLLGAGAARRGPAFLILGAGLGAALWPAALERAAERPGPLAMQLALGGLALAAVCALPAGLVALRRGPWGARLALPLLALVTAGGWFLPREEVRPLSPWYRVEVEPLWQRDTALGLMTLEPSPAGDLLLTVDRVVLTPPADEQPGDEARLLAALDLAAANWRPGDPVLEVLLAGQLTRGRLAAFERWRRASELDARLSWTAPWLPWHAEIQRWTDRFKDLPEPIPFEEAQASMGTGRFDLVVVPQVFGTPLPALEAMDAPRAVPPAALPPGRTSTDQPAVVFVAVESPLAWADLSDQVLVAGSDLDHLALGLVSGLREGVPFAPGPRTRAPGTLERLGLRAELRPSLDRARTFERLAAESPSPLIGALAAFFDDQERSSPWARPDERLELDQGRLEALAAATEVPLVPLARTTWEHLARVLITKRMSGETFAVVPGLLERLDSFPPLEHALARSYMEMLMPTEGAALLLPLYEAGWRSPEPLMDLAWALSEQDDWARAAEVYGAVLEELPGFHHAARLRALAAMRAGLSEGPALVAEILEKDPEDEDLRRYLQPGPLPPAEPVGFDPNPLGRDTEDGHDH